MILRARSPPPTSSAPAPRPNKEAVPATPPVLGSSLASALASALPALASGAFASALPALASALGPAAAACSMVCVHSAVAAGVSSTELPEKPISSVLVLYWTAPCSLATLPVWAACSRSVHRLTLLPLLLTSTLGVAVPLVIRLSDSSWVTGCAIAGAAATITIATMAPHNINFFNFFPLLLVVAFCICRERLPARRVHRDSLPPASFRLYLPRRKAAYARTPEPSSSAPAAGKTTAGPPTAPPPLLGSGASVVCSMVASVFTVP